MKKLQRPVNSGGLGLQNLVYYYYAFNLRHLAHWALPPERAPPVVQHRAVCVSPPPSPPLSVH